MNYRRTIDFDSKTKGYVSRHASGEVCCQGKHLCARCETALAAQRQTAAQAADDSPPNPYTEGLAELAAAQGYAAPSIDIEFTNGVPDGYRTALRSLGVLTAPPADDTAQLDAMTAHRAAVYDVVRKHRSVPLATSNVHLNPRDAYADALAHREDRR